MTTRLGLPGWQVLSVSETPDGRSITVEPRDAPYACPACGGPPEFYGHGRKPTTYLDLPAHGRATRLVLQRRRYRCRGCGATFLQPLSGVDGRHRITARLAEWIVRECRTRTFADVAREIGADEKTIRNIFAASAEDRPPPGRKLTLRRRRESQ